MIIDNDRDLLEMAAKASEFHIVATKSGAFYEWYNGGANGRPWNPLTDDGDALRLAVKLKLDMVFEFDRIDVTARHMGDVTEYIYELPTPTDEHAATRRAIVRAAAAIGEKL